MSRALCLILMFSLFCPFLLAEDKVFDPSRSDPKAIALSKNVARALGGEQAWNDARFLRFDFVSVRDGKSNRIRSHWWDKYTGRHRVEGKTKEGEPWIAIHNLNSREGSAFKNGVKLEGDEAKEILDRAYGTWINDTYWLLMPFKMNDPGVILKYDGEEKIDEKTYDKVVLTFEDVGLTPKDKYWAYVNRDTGLVDRWAFILKGGEGPPTHYWWRGWSKHGKVMMAPERVAIEDGSKLVFENLAVTDSMPDSVFTTP